MLQIKRDKEEFFKVLNFFSKAMYYQKVAFMKEAWGEIASTMTVTYSDGCTVTINKDLSGKYYFDFECDNLSYEELNVNLPEYAQSLLALTEEDFRKKYPEIISLKIEANMDEAEEPVLVEENKKELDDTTLDGYKYYNIYRGININKK